MTKDELFLSHAEMKDFTVLKTLPEWEVKDLPGQIVKVDHFARLEVVSGGFLFKAYDDKDSQIYEERFDEKNQQTLLKPGIRHLVMATDENSRYILHLFQKSK